MSEVIYSKKQINPLVEKYKINVEKNMIFQSLITMFKEQTNYQIWAIKAVFENVTNIDEIQRIKVWEENNKTEIKNLIKGNIILYKTPSDFKQLADEMRGLDMLKFVKDSINKFNTNQRAMLKKEILTGIDNGLKALGTSKFLRWYEIFRKMSTLVRHRQEKLISTSSAINDDISFLKHHIESALAESYEWDKEDMLGFMARNASDCSVVHNEGNIVVINVPSFKSSKIMCGNGRTGWCLTREDRYFNQYVKDVRDAKQYFFFDFSKPENHELAHIGFTVRSGYGITNAHSTKNSNLCGDGINVNGRRVNVHTALADAKVPTSVYIHLKDLKNYKWDVEAFLKFVESNKREMAVSVAEGNRFIIRPLTNSGFEKLINHTLIDYRNFAVNNDTKTYVLIDFNLPKDAEESVMVMHYVKDQYKIDTLNIMRNAYNADKKRSNYLETIGITTDMYLNREEIDPSILLHKLIDEQSEKEAIDLIMKENDKLDINYEFNNITPIFKVINNKMFNLFKVIVNNKKFDSSACDVFGESLLQSLIYNYSEAEQDSASVKKMIDTILDSENFDFNSVNINLDTAINVACEEENRLWIVEKLVANPNVNINVVNDFNCAALGNAIRNGNLKAVKLLGKRPDLVIREEDKELAKKHGINLSDYINPQPFATHSVENVSGESVSSLSEIFAQVLRAKKN